MVDNYPFEIKKIRSGQNPAIFFISGFYSEGYESEEQDWEYILNETYPNNTAYIVNWESTVLKKDIERVCDLSDISSTAVTSELTLINFGIRTLSLIAKNSGIGKIHAASYVAGSIYKILESWKKTSKKAVYVGRCFGSYLNKHYIDDRCVIIGHSLGAAVAANVLVVAKESCISKVFLLGGAIDVDNVILGSGNVKIFNYYSSKDWVLKFLYSMAEFSLKPIGLNKIKNSNVVNVDLTSVVASHFKYKSSIVGKKLKEMV